jgi:hypothetical protein
VAVRRGSTEVDISLYRPTLLKVGPVERQEVSGVKTATAAWQQATQQATGNSRKILAFFSPICHIPQRLPVRSFGLFTTAINPSL